MTDRRPEAETRWYRTTHRWGMTNLSERDVADYDVEFWRSQWRRTRLQALVANGVASFATFRSRNPLVPTSAFAPDRDLLGEVVAAGREDGLRVCVRMDTHTVPEPLLEARAEWRVRAPDGSLLPQMCINSPYRHEIVFPLYAEILERYGVDGFTDNGGIGVGSLCHCDYCRVRYPEDTGAELPRRASMEDRAYRDWVRWNDGRVLANWEETDAYLRATGSEDTVFLGLVRKFSPLNREVARRARLLLMDCQSRNDSGSFREHVDEGLYLKGALGWSSTVAVCSSMTHHSHGYFRLTSDPEPEARMYLLSGIAGGFDPWWHHPTAYSPDRRAYEIAPPIFSWHERHADVLHDRVPEVVAGLVRSDDNDQFFGRDIGPFLQPGQMGEVTQATYRGASLMLTDARIPYRPVNLADLPDDAHVPGVLVLPNVGGLSDDEVTWLSDFVARGGGLVATGMTSLFDEDGEPRPVFALGRVLGAAVRGSTPDRRRLVEDTTGEPVLPVDAAFGVSPIPYGGGAVAVEVAPGRRVIATTGGFPAAIIGEYGRGRVAYLPVDLDRRYLRGPEPAARDLLRSVIEWCSPAGPPVELAGAGDVGVYLWRQNDRRIVHVVNYSGIDAGETLAEPQVPVGPLTLTLPGLVGSRAGVARFVGIGETEQSEEVPIIDGRLTVELQRVDDHVLIVVDPR